MWATAHAKTGGGGSILQKEKFGKHFHWTPQKTFVVYRQFHSAKSCFCPVMACVYVVAYIDYMDFSTLALHISTSTQDIKIPNKIYIPQHSLIITTTKIWNWFRIENGDTFHWTTNAKSMIVTSNQDKVLPIPVQCLKVAFFKRLWKAIPVIHTFAHLQSVSWSLAEFRHNKIVQSPYENYFNVCRQHKEKWDLVKMTIIQIGW